MDATTRRRLTLFLASFLVLYFELCFIRWVPAQVRVLAYFTNFVLVACFFGMGLGMVLARYRVALERFAAPALVQTMALALLFKGVWVLPKIEESLFLEYEGDHQTSIALFPVLVLFHLSIAAGFVPLGQIVGRAFGDDEPLLDYALNLIGSIAGIAAFFVYSWLALPAWTWFALGFPLLALLARGALERGVVVAIAVVVPLVAAGVDRGTIWSPYQKIAIVPFGIDKATGHVFPFHQDQADTVEFVPMEVGFNLQVNNDFYQFPVDLRDETLAKYPNLRTLRGQYDLPYTLKPGAKRALIVGGGSGNDAAAALRHGVEHVDVVEIDPEIVRIGRTMHPERPYDDPRVHVHVDDARHFFHHAEPGYDVVVFALLDSHRLLSSMSSLRLDSYVFTLESFAEAKRVLRPDGVQVTAFAFGQPWMQSRFYEMLRTVYGTEPVVVHEAGIETFGGIVYVSSPQGAPPGLPVKHRDVDATAVLPTDDWPNVYSRNRAIPGEYLVSLALVLLSSVLLHRVTTGRREWPNAHFFFLGVAFLLLETKNVTTLALAFGSTWYVNSVVFLSFLAMSLLSALVVSRVRSIPVSWAYAGLFLSVAINAAVPLQELAGASLVVRVVLVGGLTALPVFFSGMVFAGSFQRTPDPVGALGANVLGGVLGGAIEYTSMVFGLRSLFVLVALAYGLSLWALWRRDALGVAPEIGATGG